MLLEKLYLKKDLVLNKQNSTMEVSNYLSNIDGKEMLNKYMTLSLRVLFPSLIDLKKTDQICMAACFMKYYIKMS